MREFREFLLTRTLALSLSRYASGTLLPSLHRRACRSARRTLQYSRSIAPDFSCEGQPTVAGAFAAVATCDAHDLSLRRRGTGPALLAKLGTHGHWRRAVVATRIRVRTDSLVRVLFAATCDAIAGAEIALVDRHCFRGRLAGDFSSGGIVVRVDVGESAVAPSAIGAA